MRIYNKTLVLLFGKMAVFFWRCS